MNAAYHPDRPLWVTDNEMGGEHRFWTRANVGEVFPEPPSPLGWDLVVDRGILQGWRDCMMNRLGGRPDDLSAERPEMIGIFGGYAYLGATMIRVWGERTPGMSAEIVDAAYFGDHPDVPPYVAEPWHSHPEGSETMARWLGWVMTADDLPELRQDRDLAAAARRSRPDLATASDAALMARARGFGPDIRRLFDQHIHMSAAAAIGPGVIGAVCAALGRPSDALDLMAGLGDVDSAEPSYALWDLSRRVPGSHPLTAAFDEGPRGLWARLADSDEPDVRSFLDALDAFLVEFGSRGPNEWEIQARVWESDPDLVLAAVDRMRLTPDAQLPASKQAARDEERQRLAVDISASLEADPETRAGFEAAVRATALFVPARERTKTSIIRVVHEVRMAVAELGRRAGQASPGVLEAASDICYLWDAELEDFLTDPPSFADTIAARRAHHAELMERDPPFIIHEAVPPPDAWPRRDRSAVDVLGPGDSITGAPGCPGMAQGRARVVFDPGDPRVLEPGDVLVAPFTDPAWTPLFVAAAAVVVDVGATLSHAVIVSRELGIPCVVSATAATRRIPDGAEVEVDGARGTVTVLS